MMDKGYKKDGVYVINPTLKQGKHFSVYCEFQWEKGIAWTVIQRRVNGLVDFNRNWSDYENGFGFLNGSFWLGLWKMHALTSERGIKATLRVNVKSKGLHSESGFAEYGEFAVGDSSTKYQLHVARYDNSGTIGDSLSGNGYQSDQMKFTTLDQDNDTHKDGNCAVLYSGGWWFSSCFTACLNCLYPPEDLVVSDCEDYESYAKYISWYTFNSCFGDIIFSELKIRTR